MKVIDVLSLTGTDRDVNFNAGRSVRPILDSDGMGFSVHKTIIPKGEPHNWHYKNHLEACYCISGMGELINLETNEKFTIKPHTIYALNNNDNHTFQALEDTILISIFNPPCKGQETHKKDGSYEI